MGALGDLRDDLTSIYYMLPLSDREKMLARLILYGEGQWDVDKIFREPEWWGEKAIKAARAILE